MHFEDDGDGPHVDVFVDAGDWDVENRHEGDRATARRAAINSIMPWPEERAARLSAVALAECPTTDATHTFLVDDTIQTMASDDIQDMVLRDYLLNH